MTITKADNRKTVTVHVGEPVEISLLGNGTPDTWAEFTVDPQTAIKNLQLRGAFGRADSIQRAFKPTRTGTITLSAAHGAACLFVKNPCVPVEFSFNATLHVVK